MKTITTTVYNFNELSDKAKEKARDWYREASAGDNYFAESVIEDAEQCAAIMGIGFHKRGNKHQEPCVFWSGFSSQGDGACFEGSWHASAVKAGELEKHAPEDKELHRIAAEFERIARMFPESKFSVKHKGHYSHEHCTEFDVFISDNKELEMTPESLRLELRAEEDLTHAAKDFMRWIYRQLEKEYEYQNSDAQIDETILANEYTFTIDGQREG